MTWVIAQPTIFGQVICLSDIQVSFADGTYLDCLQKMHIMDRNVIAGFAGNVIGGFALLDNLSETILKYKKDKDGVVLEPEDLINNWSIIVRDYFSCLRPEIKNSGVHILIGGISHSKNMGIPGMGKPCVAILKSPFFKPEFSKLGKWVSIGSGSQIEKYLDVLDEASGDPYHPSMQMESSRRGGYAQAISISISSKIRKMDAIKGISQHFYIATLSLDGVSGGKSDCKIFPKEGPDIDFKMPQTAGTLKEFLKLTEQNGKSKILAVAIGSSDKNIFNTKIEAVDYKIDQLVYGLYGLGEGESN